MKLTIAIAIASIVIIGLADFSDGTFILWPPVTCAPPAKTTKKPKPTTRPPPPPSTRPPATQPPKTKPPKTKPPKTEPPKTNPPTAKPTTTVPPTHPPKPCGCHECGPGGVACQGCKGRDDLCQDLVALIRDIDHKIRQCVCGEKFF